jgi:uncharacterized phage-like protein YoqJ
MRIGCTGHRPHRLGGYSDDIFKKLIDLAHLELIKYQNCYLRGITGMALGWDQAFAMACIRSSVPFVAAVPFKGQERQWPPQAQSRYKYILGEAAEIVYTSEKYTGYAMDKRNHYIVDNSDIILALYSGEYGGTRNCIKYAAGKGKSVTNLWDKWLVAQE